MSQNNETSLELVVARLEKVERANRRLTLVSFALGAMLVLILALAAVKPAAVPDVIRAKKLEIVDDKGKTVAIFSTNPKEDPFAGPYLALLGKGSKAAVMLFSQEAVGRGLMIVGDNDRLQAELAYGGLLRGSRLGLYSDQMPRLHFSMNKKDEGKLVLQDKDGKVIWQAPPK